MQTATLCLAVLRREGSPAATESKQAAKMDSCERGGDLHAHDNPVYALQSLLLPPARVMQMTRRCADSIKTTVGMQSSLHFDVTVCTFS